MSTSQYNKCHLATLSQHFAQATGKPSYLNWQNLKYMSSYLFFYLLQHEGRKDFRYHWDSHSPQLDHSPPAGVVKYRYLIICADLILSSWRPALSFKATLLVETVCRFFVTAALSQSHIHLNNAEVQHQSLKQGSEAQWEEMRKT